MITRNTFFINFYLNIHICISHYFFDLFKFAFNRHFSIDQLRKLVSKYQNISAIQIFNFEVTFTSENRLNGSFEEANGVPLLYTHIA